MTTGLSYTVTRLTANASYNVTVTAVSSCCGAGPVSDIIMVMTSIRPPAPRPTTTTVLSSAATPTPGNVLCTYVCKLDNLLLNMQSSHVHTS